MPNGLSSAWDSPSGIIAPAPVSPEPVLPELDVKLRARDAQRLRRLRLVELRFHQRLLDHRALDALQIAGVFDRRLDRRCRGRRRRRAWRTRGRRTEHEVLADDEAAFRQNGGALEEVAQLADVPWPVI